MSKVKGKCVFNVKLKDKCSFMDITKTETESEVFCKKCNASISSVSGGNSDIIRRLKAAKHLFPMEAASSSKPNDSFFPSAFDSIVASLEGVWAYHVIKANHSFKSSECARKIFRTCFKIKNFSSRQRNAKPLLLLFLPRKFNNCFKQCNYLSVYTDTSNHGDIKLFPELVRYFIPTVGVCVKILEMTSEAGETSTIINKHISAAADKYDLNKKIVAFCGNNAKVNFGDETRCGQNNVFYRLKLWLPHLIGIGCIAHIAHNALKFASYVMPFEVECVIVKIYAYSFIHYMDL